MIDLLLLATQFLKLVFKVVSGILFLILKPFFLIFRFIFYKALVKIYLFYFSVSKKLGWDKLKGNFISFLLSQKIVHIIVVVLTIYVVFIGLSEKGKAKTIINSGRNTVMAQIIKSEFGDLVEDELIEEGFDEHSINTQTHLKYLGMAGVENVPKASLEEGGNQELANDTLIAKSELTAPQIVQKNRTKPVIYKIKPGDSISTIAQEFSVSVNTILWENNLSSYSLIRPGNEITILPGTGVSHEVKSGENLSYIAKKYDITVDELMRANRLTDSSRLSIGQDLFIPGGKKATYVAKTAPASKPSYNPISTIKNIVTSQPVSSNKMAWPTVGNRITQYYSWRHKGLDLANKTGTPIFAADAGTITYSGWSTGYGYRIDVDHGGGKKTRYAHFSKLYVSVGDEVSKGEAIGEMGSTGWSTGPHLHFEVIINNVKYNPLNYIK